MVAMLLLTMWTAEARDQCWTKEVDGWTHIKVLTHDQLEADEAAQASAELRQPKPVDQGMVLVKTMRMELEPANPKWFTLIVMDATGAEILRKTFDSSIPQTPSHSGIWGAFWIGVDGAVLTAPPAYPITIHVADGLSKTRCTWTSEADGTTKWVKPPKK